MSYLASSSYYNNFNIICKDSYGLKTFYDSTVCIYCILCLCDNKFG